MGLKIAILVKQVPDHEAVVQLDNNGGLDIENRYVCSFFDEIAIEQGIAIKKIIPDAELMALSVGGKRAVEALRRSVAMGIDTVERLGDDAAASADSLFVAAVLAARLRQLGPDIVLCGKQAGDDELGAVGPMVAEFLGIPHVSAITSLEIDLDNRSALMQRKQEGVNALLCSNLPVLATTEKGLIEPHVPVVTRVMKAMKAKIPNTPVAELELAGRSADGRKITADGREITADGRIRRLDYSYPPVRPEVEIVDNAEALTSILIERGTLG